MQGITASGFLNPPASTPTGTHASGEGKTSKQLQDLGKDEFLRLLVVQLQNQDPMSPLKNEEFIAQLATFSSLEQLMSIKEAVNKIAGSTNEDKSKAGGSITNIPSK